MVVITLYTKSKRYIINSTEGTLIHQGIYKHFQNQDGVVYSLACVNGTYAPEDVGKFESNPDIIQITLPVNNTVLIIDDKNK